MLNDPDPVHAYEEMLEDFDYQEQQMIVNAPVSYTHLRAHET